MVQPTTSPLSIRPGDQRLARIDAYAKKHALSRHLAVLVLIDQGLSVIDTPEPTKVLQIEPLSPDLPRRIVGVISKPKAADAHAGVPVIDRPKFNPQPKKGKK